MPTQLKFISADLGATETTETDLGDITVPIGASRITGICACCALETGSSGDGCLGIATLKYTGAGELAGIPVNLSSMEDLGQPGGTSPRFLPVNIPVPVNRAIGCYMVLTVAQGGTARGQVHLRFE